MPASLDNRSTKALTDPGPLSRKGCYLLDDSKTALFDPATDWVKPRPAQDGQDWYFLAYGSDYKSALSQLSRLVGRVPMLPRYVFGAWFGSRAGYSGDQWKMIVKQFRDEQLPLDMLVIDSDSKTKMVWTGYDWDLEQMPDPAGFFRWMKQQGIKVTVNEHYNPLTRDSDSHFEAIRQAMGLPADVKEIPHDIANPKYAALFMDLLHKPDLDRGMAFWWQDGAAGANMAGLDPYLWTRHIEYQGSERITGRRTTAFCRLGSSWGSHRYGIFFTGDLHGVWESLPVLIPATVRGGNQLTPYMNNLCAGVFVVDLPAELYQRWVQFSSFSPLIWFHGFWGLRLPWEYGPASVENYRKFVGPALRADSLHLHLLARGARNRPAACPRHVSGVSGPGARLHVPAAIPVRKGLAGGADHRARRRQGRRGKKSFCPPARTGLTTSPASSTPADKPSRTSARWTACRCLSAPGPSCRWRPRWITATRSPSIR